MLTSVLLKLRNRKKAIYALAFFLVLYLICTETALLGYDKSLNSALAASEVPPLIGEDNFDKEPRILLVSALFPLEKSKHSHEDYADWISKFLGAVTTPVYFYTTPSFADTIRSRRGSHPIHINTSFTSPFGIPPLQGLQDTYEHQHTLDREASIHNPELYAVWNAKPWLLDNAVRQLRQQGEGYDIAFWNDAGSFRSDHQYSHWPDPKRVEEVWRAGLDRVRAAGDVETRKEDIIFFPLQGTFSWLRRYWREGDGPIDADISEGSFFGGSPEAISWWSKAFYTYHDYYLDKGFFVGKDQTLFNSLFLLFPSRFIGVWLTDPATRAGPPRFDIGPLGSCGAPWFYYQFFLASAEERLRMREQFIGDTVSRLTWPWNDWDWWVKRQECKVTRVVWMKDLLNDAFGKGWGVKKTV